MATFKAADELLRARVHPSVATLPRGEDPDSIVQKGGPGALEEYTDSAIDVLDRKIQILEKQGYLDSIEGKRRAVDGLMITVRAAADEALRDIYLDRVAEVTGVQKATLQRELQRAAAESRRRAGHRRTEAPAAEIPKLGAERKLLLLLIRDRTLVPAVAKLVEPESFLTPAYREIYRALLDAMDRQPADPDESDSLEWAEGLSPELYERVRGLAADPEELTNPDAVLDDAIARLRARSLEKRLADLMTEVLVADTGAGVELASEIKKIRQELSALGVRTPGRGLFRRD